MRRNESEKARLPSRRPATAASMRPADHPPEAPRTALVPDEQLMARIGAGDPSAMSELVARHQRALLNFFLRYTNELALAEDLTQETMLRVLKSAGAYQPLAPFGVWLFRVAKNLCLNELDARRTRRRPIDDAARRSGSPEEDLDRAEHEARIRQAIRRLPERQRLALVLHRFEGLPLAEIAQIMETNAGAVEGLLSRASAALRADLEDLLGIPGAAGRARARKRP